MVASHSPVPPTVWMPTARILGALFAGSAVMFAATAVNGGSLLVTSDGAGPLPEPSASLTGTEQGTFTTNQPAPASAPGQAVEWTPGATPQWGSSLGDLPVRRAPVQETPWYAAPAPATEDASVAPAVPERAAAEPAAERAAAEPAAPEPATAGASTGTANSTKPAPQTANPRRAGQLDSLLGGVLDTTDGLSR